MPFMGAGKERFLSDLTEVDGSLFFLTYRYSSTERSLCRKAAGVSTASVVKTLSATTGELTSMANTLFFYSQDDDHGCELWRSDGTASATRRRGRFIWGKVLRSASFAMGFVILRSVTY